MNLKSVTLIKKPLDLLAKIGSVLPYFTQRRILTTFSVSQILREINFGESRSNKTAVSPILGALKMINLVNFSLQKMQKLIKIKI